MKYPQNLSQLMPGQHARVTHIDTVGAMRRRLMDLGLTLDTEIMCLGRSPFGDPSAYLIRGAVIAIRAKDSQNIIIETE